MKLRVRLTLTITIMTAAIIAVISVILLREAHKLQISAALESTSNLTYAESVEMV